jgi:hypothetical protein
VRARGAATLVVAGLALCAAGCVSYRPKPLDEVHFEDRIEWVGDDDVRIGVAALGAKEAEQAFGVSVTKKGMQPVWLSIENRSATPIYSGTTRASSMGIPGAT